MNPQTWLSLALAIGSVVAQLIALSAVRSWGTRTGKGAAVWLRRRWDRLRTWGGRQPAPTVVAPPTAISTVQASDGVTVHTMPQHLADDLSSYMAALDARFNALAEDGASMAERLAALEALADLAAAREREEAADAAVVERWIIRGTVLAGLAAVVQVLPLS